MKKKYLLIVTSIVIVSILIGISVMLLLKRQYTDHLPTLDLYHTVYDKIEPKDEMRILDYDVILEISDNYIEDLIDYTVVRAQNAKNINEIGIFRVKAGTQTKVKSIIENYVQKKVASYRAMDYFPEEIEKIDFATVKVIGSYVIYSFLNEKDTHNLYHSIEDTLRK